MRTFDNFSGRMIDHDEINLKFKDIKSRVKEEPQGETWQCPRCGNPLDCVAEHAFAELWECAQCGYDKRVKV